MRTATAALLAAAALGAGACGDDSVDPIEQSVREQEKLAAEAAKTAAPTTTATTAEAPASASIEKLSISKDLAQKPAIAKPTGDPPTKLYSRDIVTGKGKATKSGDPVTVQYVGVSFSNGEQFDASWDSGQPFEFMLGQGRVIGGWDQGVPGMRVGGRRLLVIPPDLAYGAAGQGAIGPNETLMFAIDLKKIG